MPQLCAVYVVLALELQQLLGHFRKLRLCAQHVDLIALSDRVPRVGHFHELPDDAPVLIHEPHGRAHHCKVVIGDTRVADHAVHGLGICMGDRFGIELRHVAP